MASLADLLGSVNTSNMNPANVRAAPAGFQRPRGLVKTVGTIADVLSALGGGEANYTNAVNARENAYNQSMQRQQFQNVFRNFLENPNDQAAFADVAVQAPAEALKFREALAPKPQAQGSMPREVIIANMLEDPNTPPNVRARLEAMLAPEPRQATGSDFQIIEGANGFQRVNRVTGEVTPLGVSGRPPAASGGGRQAGNTMFERRAEAIRKQFGDDAYAQFIATGKFTPPGGGAPSETGALINEAKQLLPAATSGGLQSAAAIAQGAVGVGTRAMEADERLNVIGARLVATVPRFEGPQSDKDTALYRQAAADVANPAKPRNVRLAALNTVERLNQRAVARRQANTPAPAGNFVVIRRRPAGGQ